LSEVRGRSTAFEKIAAMNAEAKAAPLAATSVELEVRIADERRRLLLDQNLQINLEGQRIAPLEAGDDEALDRIEAQINHCCDRQARIQERLEILQRRVDEARAAEHAAELDAIAEHAQQARKIGERLIQDDYPKLARTLANLLQQLSASDAIVADANRALTAAGRPSIASSNQVRCTSSGHVSRIVEAMVEAGDIRHPLRESAYRGRDGRYFSRLDHAVVPPISVEITEQQFCTGYSPDRLWKQITLPGVEPHPLDPDKPKPSDFWKGSATRVPVAAVEALLAQIEQDKATVSDNNGAGRGPKSSVVG
jgi:chaperonin cofactor prefoldin